MHNNPELIVMLTHDDFTVSNAREIFEQCAHSKVMCWGMKESPLQKAEMKALYGRMKECNKTTFLEVVAYTEQEGLAGAEMAAECGCDILMGTTFYDSINGYCAEHGLKYMPFVGTVEGRPSVLKGDVEEIVLQARECVAKGAYGVDLLGYRYQGDVERLCRALISGVDAPVCMAGGVDSFAKLDEVKSMSPWAFTIGSAFFENKFGDSFGQQLDVVHEYINRDSEEGGEK